MYLHPAEGQIEVKELGKVCPYVRLQGQPGEEPGRREPGVAPVYPKHRPVRTRKELYTG